MSEEKTVPAMSDAELERMLAQAGAASVQVPEGFRCGYVAVIGRPNVGKSTLINHLIGEKVSITSKKPQTTRDRVLGVVTEPDAQIVFMDTPGFQTKVGNQLIRRMNRTVRSTLGEVDAIVFVIESLGWKPADLEVLKLLPRDAANVILAINKTDLNKSKDSLLPLMAASMEPALRSGIFFSAISRTCACVSWPTLVLLGLPLPDSRPSAFLMSTGTGGVLVMKVKARSE